MNTGGYMEGAHPGALAYLLDLIENLRSGTWQQNCREYEGPSP